MLLFVKQNLRKRKVEAENAKLKLKYTYNKLYIICQQMSAIGLCSNTLTQRTFWMMDWLLSSAAVRRVLLKGTISAGFVWRFVRTAPAIHGDRSTFRSTITITFVLYSQFTEDNFLRRIGDATTWYLVNYRPLKEVRSIASLKYY